MARTHRIDTLLFEAYRRNDMARNNPHESQKPLTKRWLGLGTAAAYRPVLTAGLMVWHDGRTPPPRCMGWLCLTDAGVAALEAKHTEFARALAQLHTDERYHRSYQSQYMLTGGLTSYRTS